MQRGSLRHLKKPRLTGIQLESDPSYEASAGVGAWGLAMVLSGIGDAKVKMLKRRLCATNRANWLPLDVSMAI